MNADYSVAQTPNVMVIEINEHKLIVNLIDFEISHKIGNHMSQLKINSNNLLSIESELS
jgi:hypothetical protein